VHITTFETNEWDKIAQHEEVPIQDSSEPLFIKDCHNSVLMLAKCYTNSNNINNKEEYPSLPPHFLEKITIQMYRKKRNQYRELSFVGTHYSQDFNSNSSSVG
jgi:hypothetical protein